MEVISKIVDAVNGILWDKNILLFLLVGTGIWYTIQLKFIQIRGFGEGFRRTFGGLFKKSEKAGADGMSQFQSLATAIAAQVGTGNLAGAATAIAVGGPGAIFWMWVSAFFGMATIYAEAVMAQKYKQVGEDKTVTGGPVYYIEGAFKGKFGKILASLFAIFIILAVLSFVVFSGGISRIAKVTETIVPIMALFYIIGSLIVILVNFRNIPLAFQEIFVGAFAPQSIAGGVIGATIQKAMSKGVARGLFSNEAGMGSTPHAHAVAKVDHPSEQGFVAMMGVFIDTFVILNLTALVIITTRSVTPDGSIIGTALTQAGFSSVFGKFGDIFIAICMFFFAFSTIIGWYFFGEANIKYLFGSKAVKIYGVLVCICVLLGTLGEVSIVWTMSDMFNGLMVIPNLVALLALTGTVKAVHNEYIKKNGGISSKGKKKNPTA